MRFQDRRQAGRALATLLTRYRSRPDVRVLALGRGAVPVAYEVAQELQLPLEVYGVCRLSLPGRPEPSFGAVASGGAVVIDREIMNLLGVTPEVVDETVARQRSALRALEGVASFAWPPVNLEGSVALLVDEGLARASGAQAAILSLRRYGPGRLVVAAPVACSEALATLQEEADEVVCVLVPAVFDALAYWYEAFPPVSDAELRMLLAGGARERPARPSM